MRGRVLFRLFILVILSLDLCPELRCSVSTLAVSYQCYIFILTDFEILCWHLFFTLSTSSRRQRLQADTAFRMSDQYIFRIRDGYDGVGLGDDEAALLLRSSGSLKRKRPVAQIMGFGTTRFLLVFSFPSLNPTIKVQIHPDLPAFAAGGSTSRQHPSYFLIPTDHPCIPTTPTVDVNQAAAFAPYFISRTMEAQWCAILPTTAPSPMSSSSYQLYQIVSVKMYRGRRSPGCTIMAG